MSGVIAGRAPKLSPPDRIRAAPEWVPFLVLVLALAGHPPSIVAQAQVGSLRVELGVEPRQVTVGDVFRAVARVTAPAGYSVRYLDFVSGDSVAAVAPLELVASTGPSSIAVYSLVAWAAGPEVQARMGIEVTGPDGTSRIHDVRLQLPRIVSVLPQDSTELAPRPAKGLLSVPRADRFPWWWIALLLLLAAIAWLIYRTLTRRPSAVPLVDAREWALRQLGDDHIAAILPPGDHAALAGHISHVLRDYIERVRGELGRDLTTTELLAELTRNLPPTLGHATSRAETAEAVNELTGMLRLADRVKFAGYLPSTEETASLLGLAREWIGRWPEPIESSPPARRAA